MSKIVEIQCDGCKRREPLRVGDGGLPDGWRRLQIGQGNRHWRADVCSPRCASKAVDATYERDDRQELERHGLRAL